MSVSTDKRDLGLSGHGASQVPGQVKQKWVAGDGAVVPSVACRGVLVQKASSTTAAVNIKLAHDDDFDLVTLATNVVHPLAVVEINATNNTADSVFFIG